MLWQRLESGLGLVPSIELIQSLIEYAWTLGYDPEGAQQLKQTVVGTRKWIGTCEIYCLMHSLGLKVKVTDFPIATGPNQSHPAICDWIEAYFDGSSSDFDKALAESHEFPIIFNRNNDEGIHDTEKLPLYFQYQYVQSGNSHSQNADTSIIFKEDILSQ
ncbi:hypothetical protein HDU79_007233 [Rhizoclosmatium sp. JEL0117]|nr:hypothetical protein HDU79_007233 [Rhizoclosmatium sp. JEL0117]